MKKIFFNRKGQTLVSTLVALGITAIIAGAMATVFSNQRRESRALEEKLGALDLDRQLINLFASPALCTQALTGGGQVLIKPKAGLKPVEVPKLTGTDVDTTRTPPAPISPFSQTLFVRSVKLVASAANSDAVDIVVEFDQGKLVRALKSLQVSGIVVTTDAVGRITACGHPANKIGERDCLSPAPGQRGYPPDRDESYLEDAPYVQDFSNYVDAFCKSLSYPTGGKTSLPDAKYTPGKTCADGCPSPERRGTGYKTFFPNGEAGPFANVEECLALKNSPPASPHGYSVIVPATQRQYLCINGKWMLTAIYPSSGDIAPDFMGNSGGG